MSSKVWDLGFESAIPKLSIVLLVAVFGGFTGLIIIMFHSTSTLCFSTEVDRNYLSLLNYIYLSNIKKYILLGVVLLLHMSYFYLSNILENTISDHSVLCE